MKAIKYLSILLLGALVSCQSLLDEKKTTLLSEKDVYSTEESLEACISGCYAKMGSGQGWKGGMIEYLQEASGLVHWSGMRSEEHWLQCLDFTLYSNNTWNEQFFIALNEYIAAANLLITKLPGSPVDEGFKREIEAEARFIRAVCYFSLVRMYGDVPLHTRGKRCKCSAYAIYESIQADTGRSGLRRDLHEGCRKAGRRIRSQGTSQQMGRHFVQVPGVSHDSMYSGYA